MAIFNFQILLYSLSLSFFCILFPQTTSLTFIRFNLTNEALQDQNANITTFGDANFSTEGLQLTGLKNQVGKATYIDRLHLWDNSTSTRNLTDFSTHFVFVIDSEEHPNFAGGFTFFLAPNGSHFKGNGAMGLPIKPGNWRERTDNFVAVEFDTFWSGAIHDGWEPVNVGQAPHVGIDVSSLTSNVSAVWYPNIPAGIPNEAWIRYDSSSFNLSVVFTSSKNTTRVQDTIHLIIDLSNYLPEWVTFGFSASSGPWFSKTTVKSWEFSTSLEINRNVPINRNVTNPVIPRSKKISLGAVVGLVVGSVVLLGLLDLVGFGLWRRSRAKEEHESEAEKLMENEFESSAGPKKFSYDQLSQATNNFEEEQKLGQGGFGGVYKGFLSELNSYIAVKRISKESKQGIKEYAAEVKIISRLRHRNLVQLIGWCHEKKELLLVYEFMENASLDFHLFKGKSLLPWGTRYKIAQGLASALLYLHEEWEQCVVHRDVKSGNVMLDSNFNAKLGDFGLARLVDHEKEPQTTALVGTMGYLAPEYVAMGKASKESDVYSFGVVALEIACGQMRMVEWVWDLYGMGRLLEAADPKLGLDFDEQKMERLMIVGLWCAHPDHKFRPNIRQAIHVLNAKAPLPILPKKRPAVFAPPLNTISTSSMTSQNKYSSFTSNTDSSKFISSSTTSSPYVSLLNEM